MNTIRYEFVLLYSDRHMLMYIVVVNGRLRWAEDRSRWYSYDQALDMNRCTQHLKGWLIST